MSEAIILGPFSGGLNNVAAAATVADNELSYCMNFEVDLDGSLQSRPPIVETATGLSEDITVTVIGSAVLAGGTYLFASSSSNLYYRLNEGAWTLLQAGVSSRVAIQHNVTVYFVATATSSSGGGRWDGTTWTNDTSMPRGEAALIYKTRLFVVPGMLQTVNTSRLSYSDVITGAALTWGASNYIDVSPGKQKLVDLAIYNDNLMLFKEDSTHVLTYDSTITSAVLRELNSSIGASSYRCMVSYENSLYIYHHGAVYEIVNYNFSSISEKIFFENEPGYIAVTGGTLEHDVFLGLLGDRLILRYYAEVFAYKLNTKTWSTWDCQDYNMSNFGPFVEVPSPQVSGGLGKYYAGSARLTNHRMYILHDDYSRDIIEETLLGETPIICSLITKIYSFNTPQHYKKLMWWGADVRNSGPFEAYVSFEVSSRRTLWSEVADETWDSINAYWNSPVPVISVDTIGKTSGYFVRKFMKFFKTLRFRQAKFSLVLETSGKTFDGPCRVYSLTAIVGGKQLVESQVN